MISIVVPAFNEEEGIGQFIRSLLRENRLKEEYELVLVNDGSTDRTKEMMESFARKNKRIRVVSYLPNKGLGHALRTGMRHARGRIIVTMDSDAAHPPKDIHCLVQAVDRGWDVAIGSRYVKGGSISRVPLTRVALSRLTNLVTCLIILSTLKDLTNGFRAYRAGELRKIQTKARGFEVEIELLVRLKKAGAKITEVPVAASAEREAGTSKFNLWKHSTKYIMGLSKIFAYRWL